MGVRRRRENRGIREEWGCQDLAAKANAEEVATIVCQWAVKGRRGRGQHGAIRRECRGKGGESKGAGGT